MDKINKLTLPATILIASIILGGFYYASQISKQKSIERQQQIEIEQEKQVAVTESLFEKQERCANNRENAIKQLEDTYSLATPYFYDIFYSPKTDTCVYTYGLLLYGTSPDEIGSFGIADYFTGEQLFSVKYDNSSKDSSEYSYNIRPQHTQAVESYRN